MTATEKPIVTAKLKTNKAATPAPSAPLVTAPVAMKKLIPKTPAKRVSSKVAPAIAKAAAKAPVKAVIKTAAKPVVKAVLATSMNPTNLPKVEKMAKVKKPKLVRDSFTIPKGEYAVLDELKQRATRLNSAVKKSELIRAGIKALAAMSDTTFLAALKAVPTIKTGRPTKSKLD